MSKELNIKSSTLEKGLDLAKDFLDKLIMPAVEETGLLIKDRVTLWKLKNQINILNKTKEYCEKHNIEPRRINFKLLVPLIETSALEEEEFLQDKWAVLLANMVDSEQNIENHVFPYILSQISIDEFIFIEENFLLKKIRIKKINTEIEYIRVSSPEEEKDLLSKIAEIENKLKIEKIEIANKDSTSPKIKLLNLSVSLTKYRNRLRSLNNRITILKNRIKEPQTILNIGEIKGFEISNLIRLGLIKEVHETFANSQSIELPDPQDYWSSVDFDIDIESNVRFELTELGEIFIEACSEKSIIE